MSTAIAITDPAAPQSWLPRPANIKEALEICKLISESGMVPKDYINKPAAVLVAIEKGAELGLSPMAALQNISVINGRPCVWGDALLALAISHSSVQDVIEEMVDDDKGVPVKAVCTVIRKGRKPVTRTFSRADANVAGLTNKSGPHQQYPRRMLQLRARGFALRDACPDILSGIQSTEEATEDRDIIDATPDFQEPKEGTFSSKPKKQHAETGRAHAAAQGDVAEEEEALLAAIATASSEAEANSLLPRIRKLPESSLERIRGPWAERKKCFDEQGAGGSPARPASDVPVEKDKASGGGGGKSWNVGDVSEGTWELIGMVSHIETREELDAIKDHVAGRKLNASEKGLVDKAIKDKAAELSENLRAEARASAMDDSKDGPQQGFAGF